MMGDKHVCSMCNENLGGKQHVKIVFENWPQEVTVTYRRKGKEYHRKKSVTKEIITALGMECLSNTNKWVEIKELEEAELTPFFTYLSKLGKNPLFGAMLTANGPLCITQNCRHRMAENCQHLFRGESEYWGLDTLRCLVGHPGEVLVRQKSEGRQSWIKVLSQYLSFAWKPEHGVLTRLYFATTYGFAALVLLPLYMLIAYPYWGLMVLKNRLTLRGGN